MAVYEYDLKEILPRLNGPLKEILDREISAGNSITEISAPWPMKNANIWLSKKFHDDYTSSFPSLQYKYLGDPKNWIEEYVDIEGGFMLAVSASVSI